MVTSTGAAGFDQDKRSVTKQLNGLLNSDNDYIKQARTAGTEYASSRGLLNSSIGAGASQKAAISAALPIAQQEANTANNEYMTRLGTDESIRKGAYDVTANTQGAYLSSIDKITNNAMISINEIETAQGITQAEKDKMIANTTARRDADLAWTRSLYSNMPTWDMSWTDLESMPAAPGLDGSATSGTVTTDNSGQSDPVATSSSWPWV